MGVMRILDHFEMYSLKDVNISEAGSIIGEDNLFGPPQTLLCSRGFWVKVILLLIFAALFTLFFFFFFDSYTPKQVVY